MLSDMRRISIDVTDEQHRRLKATAALQGKSIKAFVLERTLGASVGEADGASDARIAVLKTNLESSLPPAPAPASGARERTVKEIFAEARRLAGAD